MRREGGFLLCCDIDGTLLGDPDGARALASRLAALDEPPIMACATGRSLDEALEAFSSLPVELAPSALACDVGASLYRAMGGLASSGAIEVFPGWEAWIAEGWDRDAVVRAIEGLPGIRPQEPWLQGPYKASWYVDPSGFPGKAAAIEALDSRGLSASVSQAFGFYLDALPPRAGKDGALRFLAKALGLPTHRVVCAGDSGNDESMLGAGFPAIIVGNHEACLEALRGSKGVHFAKAGYARGVLEGLEALGFM